MHSRSSALRSLLSRITGAVALLALVNCGDSASDSGGSPSTGGNGGSPGSGGAGGNDVAGGSGGEVADGGAGGTGGAGGGPVDEPVFDFAMVGTPDWKPVDYHQFTVTIGNGFSNFSAVTGGLLPEPEHVHFDGIGIGPGAAHAGPYDGELATNVAALGYVDKGSFAASETLLPEAVMSAWMMVPTASAPTGSSPDSASGPIIPNSVFPIAVQIDVYQDDVLLDGYSQGFDVPPLDAFDPPFDVDGHSHFPMFHAVVFDGVPVVPGTIERVITMLDANDEGWTITLETTAL